jgi:RNA polymerase sigma-70 factor, ECF subfamily
MDERTDEELFDRLRNGDAAEKRRAFDTLYERYAPALTGFFVRYGCSEADTDDLTQHMFMHVYAGTGRFRRFVPAQGRFRPWLYQAARWAALEHLRARRSRRDVGVGGESEDGAAIESVASRELGSVEVLEIDDFAEAVQQCRSALPQHLRESLLAEEEGKNLDVIARLAGLCYGTAGSRRHTAHRELTAAEPQQREHWRAWAERRLLRATTLVEGSRQLLAAVLKEVPEQPPR